MQGENFGAGKGAEKSLGRGRGCVFGSSPKRLEWPHPELVHWWLLVHCSPRHGCHHIFASDITLLQTTLYLSYSEHDNKGSEVMCFLL